jgi:integrase
MLFRTYSRFVPNLTRQDGSAFDRLLTQSFAGRLPEAPVLLPDDAASTAGSDDDSDDGAPSAPPGQPPPRRQLAAFGLN